MKTPGLLYRISFLVVLNSMFIFLAVSYVSMENNQDKIDRLISCRYDFIKQYFYGHFDNATVDEANIFNHDYASESIQDLFSHSQNYMKGLAGLSLLEYDKAGNEYLPQANAYRETLGSIVKNMIPQIASEVEYESIANQGIFVGAKTQFEGIRYKTVYFPCEPGTVSPIMAVTYLPEEMVGSSLEYNTTLVLLFLVITLISLLIVHLLFRDLVRPLNHLVLGMEKTAKGEVLHQIEDTKSDEIGRVAAAFNQMSSSLWEQRKMLTASNNNLVSLNEKLTETLSKLADANNSLATSESFLSKLITDSPFPVFVTDTEKRIITFSEDALKTFELTENDAIGKDLSEFFPFAPDKLFPQPNEQCRVTNAEMICSKSSGEHFPVLMSRVAIRETNNTISAYLFILRDITESRSFQEMIISIDRMATRGVMAGEIAHEINNYLAIILGNVELLPLLLSKGKMDKVDQKLMVLRQTVTKIQTFSEGLMGYGDDDAIFEKGDLNQLVENMVVFLRPQNRYDDITWNLKFSSKIPLVEFDSSQMQQLLVNLLNNAADALRDIEIGKTITISTSLNGDNNASISITDNAEGLPEDIHECIFKERYTGMRRGRGFGLVIVKQILDKHEGDITYNTDQGKGTTFTLSLPIRKSEPEMTVAGAEVIS